MIKIGPNRDQMSEPREYASPADVENVFNIPVATLAKMRWNSTGPNYAKLGSRVLYRRSDIYAWIAQNTRDNGK